MTFVLAKISLKLGFTTSAQNNLSRDNICAKSLNYFEFKLTNFSKTKIFFIDKYTKNALQNYKTDLLLFCKIM